MSLADGEDRPACSQDGNSFAIITWQPEPASLDAILSKDWSLGYPDFQQGCTVKSHSCLLEGKCCSFKLSGGSEL